MCRRKAQWGRRYRCWQEHHFHHCVRFWTLRNLFLLPRFSRFPPHSLHNPQRVLTPSWRVWVSCVFSPMCSAFPSSLPSLKGLSTRLENSSRGSVLRAMAHLRGAVVEIGNFLLFYESSWLICFSNPRSTAIHETALAIVAWEYQCIWRLRLKSHNEKHFHEMSLETSQVHQVQWHACGPSYSGVWGSSGIQVQPGWRNETLPYTLK